jgi:hypothetical protein
MFGNVFGTNTFPAAAGNPNAAANEAGQAGATTMGGGAYGANYMARYGGTAAPVAGYPGHAGGGPTAQAGYGGHGMHPGTPGAGMGQPGGQGGDFGPTMAGVGFAAYQANGGAHGMPNGAGIPHGAQVPHRYGQGQAQHAVNPDGVGLGGVGFAPHSGFTGGAHAGPPGGPGLGEGGYVPNGGAFGGAPVGGQSTAYGGAAFTQQRH